MSGISVVIVTWNCAEEVDRCLASLDRHDPARSREVIVVDNASTDGSADRVADRHPWARLWRLPQNVGFAAAGNEGIRRSGGEYVALLNPDTVLVDDAVGALAALLESAPRAAAAAPRLLTTSGAAQPFAFGDEPTLWRLATRGARRILGVGPAQEWAAEATRPVDWVAGTCVVLRRAALREVGPLDERYFLYFEDVDWCVRARRQGWVVLHHPATSVVHLGGCSVARHPEGPRFYDASLRAYFAEHRRATERLALPALLGVYRSLVARRETRPASRQNEYRS